MRTSLLKEQAEYNVSLHQKETYILLFPLTIKMFLLHHQNVPFDHQNVSFSAVTA